MHEEDAALYAEEPLARQRSRLGLFDGSGINVGDSHREDSALGGSSAIPPQKRRLSADMQLCKVVMTPSLSFKKKLEKAQNESMSITVKHSGAPVGGVFRFEVKIQETSLLCTVIPYIQ
jgi:hypothetical protein